MNDVLCIILSSNYEQAKQKEQGQKAEEEELGSRMLHHEEIMKVGGGM